MKRILIFSMSLLLMLMCFGSLSAYSTSQAKSKYDGYYTYSNAKKSKISFKNKGKYLVVSGIFTREDDNGKNKKKAKFKSKKFKFSKNVLYQYISETPHYIMEPEKADFFKDYVSSISTYNISFDIENGKVSAMYAQ